MTYRENHKELSDEDISEYREGQKLSDVLWMILKGRQTNVALFALLDIGAKLLSILELEEDDMNSLFLKLKELKKELDKIRKSMNH